MSDKCTVPYGEIADVAISCCLSDMQILHAIGPQRMTYGVLGNLAE